MYPWDGHESIFIHYHNFHRDLHSDLHSDLHRHVLAMLDSQVIRWAAPFDFAQPRPPKPPTPPGQELALPALEDQFRSEELKRSLEAMMKDAGAG